MSHNYLQLTYTIEANGMHFYFAETTNQTTSEEEFPFHYQCVSSSRLLCGLSISFSFFLIRLMNERMNYKMCVHGEEIYLLNCSTKHEDWPLNKKKERERHPFRFFIGASSFNCRGVVNN